MLSKVACREGWLGEVCGSSPLPCRRYALPFIGVRQMFVWLELRKFCCGSLFCGSLCLGGSAITSMQVAACLPVQEGQFESASLGQLYCITADSDICTVDFY